MRQIRKHPWKIQIQDKYKERFFSILAMQDDRLTRRNLLGRLNFLEGPLGFGSGILCALVGLCKFGLLRLKIMLQGLELLAELLELLLYLADPGLVLLARGLLLGRFALGLG